MAAPQRLELTRIRWAGPQLAMEFELGPHPFHTSIWYGDVDLDALAQRIGHDAMDCLAFHIAAFEINKLASLRPLEISFGPWARFVTPRFAALFTEVLVHVWAQWRYEHDLPEWRGPALVDAPTGACVRAQHASAAGGGTRQAEALLFFGGGKDSVVAASLFERIGASWSSHSYAHSAYGPPDGQFALIDTVLGELAPTRRHRQWVADTAFGAPLVALLPARGAKTFTAAETPSSIFEALPTALFHGYSHIVLAHEHSANRGNLIWAKTGEDVNHQWGKSWAAERLLATYIREEIVENFGWFSVLQPLSDVLIFELLRGAGDARLRAHSCNVEKPWCHRCAKCAYVALGYAAHLADGDYERVFEEDVVDLPENEHLFRELMGLTEHTPFECVGGVDETRLALALCAARGRACRAVRIYEREVAARSPLDVDAVLARHAIVHEPHAIPSDLAAKIVPIMRDAAESARVRIRALLAR
jgi:hypothetical protein